MKAQAVIDLARLNHLRELKEALRALKAENAALRDENAQLKAHLDFAILAARELESLSDEAQLVIMDGWNLILGANRSAHSLPQLLLQAEEHLREHPNDLVWIVLDGPRFASKMSGRVRVTYTGGVGEHRADKFICDFLRMARLRGLASKIKVHTFDKDFIKSVKRICC